MIKTLTALLALSVATPTVLDGDTVRIAGVSIRLTDYDAPELFHPRCAREYAWAQAAKRELEQTISRVSLRMVPCAYSNYGRLCAEGTLDGKPLAAHMIAHNLAASYVCTPGHCPHKRNWC